jgi:hypothetical protein
MQRFEEAEILYANDKTTGAVYLAGYGVECILKSQLQSRLPLSQQKAHMKLFRGDKGHNLEGLKAALQRQGLSIPASLARPFRTVCEWETDWRYYLGKIKHKEARSFLDAASEIIRWMERQS